MNSAARIVRPPKRVRNGAYSFDDFCRIVKDGEKADLLNGVIYMASPDNLNAGELFTWLFSLLGNFLDVTEQGQLYGQRIAFRISDDYGPEPDIAFVKKSRLHLRERGYFNGPPDLAIEIVSPDSVERDYELKMDAYEEFGVSEYWIVDEDQERVHLLCREATGKNAKGKFREVRAKKGILTSRVLGGFWFKPEWLWANSRPKKSQVLAEILGPRL